MPVAELLDRISSRELSEWMIFHQLEPFGSEIDFFGHAITAATVANVNRAKGQKTYKPADFLPEFDKAPQSVAEQIQFAEMITAALGGKDLRANKEDADG